MRFIEAGDFREALEPGEKGRRCVVQVDEDDGRTGVFQRMINPDRRFQSKPAIEAAMRKKGNGGLHPEHAVKSIRGGCVWGQHPHPAVLGKSFGDQPLGDLESSRDARLEIDCRHGQTAALSCESSQVVSSGMGRPVAPFSFPSFHATPAMSRCAQSYFLPNLERKHAALMPPPARVPILAKSAKLLSSASWYSSQSGICQPRSNDSSPALRRARARLSLLLNTPQATCPNATTIAPVRVATSTTAEGSYRSA